MLRGNAVKGPKGELGVKRAGLRQGVESEVEAAPASKAGQHMRKCKAEQTMVNRIIAKCLTEVNLFVTIADREWTGL